MRGGRPGPGASGREQHRARAKRGVARGRKLPGESKTSENCLQLNTLVLLSFSPRVQPLLGSAALPTPAPSRFRPEGAHGRNGPSEGQAVPAAMAFVPSLSRCLARRENQLLCAPTPLRNFTLIPRPFIKLKCKKLKSSQNT